MLSGAIKKLVHDTKWGELDYLLIDMPPGTGDVYLTIFNELSIDKFILITTPNILAISDLQKTITMLNKLNINIFGYISNNIFNVEDKNSSILISDNINHLGTYKFDKNLHDFNLDYNSEITEEISKRILSDT
jgi:ATP-binding protein involved in chromosome partitioning